MTTADVRWRRINELFHAALERASGEREAYLAGECGADPRLHMDIQSLLAAHGGDGSAPPADLTGARVGDYQVTSFIDAGAMGQVYRARDTRLGRDVALKILPPACVMDPDRRARFEWEARTLASLTHPHIATIYGVEDADGVSALALELVEGETLASRIARGTLPLDEALRLARQIAGALEAAHEHGVIHRDLKPANVKVTPDGVVKVLDFGLSKLADAGTTTAPATTTAAGMLVGTPAYMSPEQARGEVADQRSDVWAFGCVLYEMLTGKPAFQGATVADTIARVVLSEPTLDGVPAPVRAVVARCLVKDRALRIPHASVIRFLLEEPNSRDAVPSSRGWALDVAIARHAVRIACSRW